MKSLFEFFNVIYLNLLQQFYDNMFGVSNCLKAIETAEKLNSSLKNRYVFTVSSCINMHTQVYIFKNAISVRKQVHTLIFERKHYFK